jgi:hypothetical protein
MGRPAAPANATPLRWLTDAAKRAAGIEEEVPARPLGAVVELYLLHESGEYDRDRGGVQPGCKRSAKDDRVVVELLKRQLDFALPVDQVDPDRLFDAAAAMAKENLAPNTIRNRFALRRRVFGWAKANRRKTGLGFNVFPDLERTERKRLFAGSTAKKAPPYTREQPRAIYEARPAHVYRPVRFACHSGMRVGASSCA